MKDKKYPFFKKGDVIVYALILVIGLISCIFVFYPKNDEENFIVRYRGETIMQGSIVGKVSFDETFVKKIDDLTYEITTEKGRNVIGIDREKNDLFVKSSDCHGEECMSMSLKKGGIICSPHSLVIKFSSDFVPQIG